MSEIRRIAAGAVSPLYEMGVRDERQRIIELLEETAYLGSHNDLIALIKKETDGKNV